MSAHLITMEVDPDRDQYGCKWGTNFDGIPRHSTSSLLDYAHALAESGAGWDHPPFTQIVSVEPLTDSGKEPIHRIAKRLLGPPNARYEVNEHHTGGGIVVCEVRRAEDADSPYAWISESEDPNQPFLVGVYLPADDGEAFVTVPTDATRLCAVVFDLLKVAVLICR